MKPLSYEHRILVLAVSAGLPGSLIAMILLWTGDYASRTIWTLGLLIVGLWLGFAISVRHRVAFSLQTVSNLLAAMREEDFSVRARGARPSRRRTAEKRDELAPPHVVSRSSDHERSGAYHITSLT